MATNLAKEVTSLVLATIVRAVTSHAKAISKGRAATSHDPVIIAKVVISRAKAISKEKAAISHALIIIVKVAISKEKAPTTVVHALPATILMQNIA